MPKWNFHYLCNAKKSKQKSSMPMCKGTNNISEIGKYFKGNNGGNYLPKTAEFLFASFT